MAEVVMEIVRVLAAPRSRISNSWVSPALEGNKALFSVAVSVPNSISTPSALMICAPLLRFIDALEAEVLASTKDTTTDLGRVELSKTKLAP
jgi:hypothetical protein